MTINEYETELRALLKRLTDENEAWTWEEYQHILGVTEYMSFVLKLKIAATFNPNMFK